MPTLVLILIKVADLIKAVLIKNLVPENINPVKTLDDFVKDILKDKKKQKDLDFNHVESSISYYGRFYMLLALTNSPQQSK